MTLTAEPTTREGCLEAICGNNWFMEALVILEERPAVTLSEVKCLRDRLGIPEENYIQG